MDYIEFDEKTAYAYTEKFIADKIKEIKKTFSDKCVKEKIYSKEYLSHISDPENIKVSFKKSLLYDIACDMHYIAAEYSYNYTYTYSTDGYLSGTIKIDTSSGTADTSDIHMVKDYHSSTETSEGVVNFYSTKMKKCICHFGSGEFPGITAAGELKKVNLRTTSDPEYKKLGNISITPEYITETIGLDHLPEHVKEAMKKDALKFSYGDPRNFKMHISDYRIDKCKLIIYPTFTFDISVKFNGETYGCADLKSVDEITPNGEISAHYLEYEKKEKSLKAKYNVCRWPSIKIYIFCIIMGILASVGLIVLLNKSASYGNIGFSYMYRPHMIGMIVAMIVLTIIPLLVIDFVINEGLDSSPVSYTPNESVDNLINSMEDSFRKQKNNSTVISCVFLAVMLVVSSIIGVITMNMYKKTDVDNYWYTPEIVQKYEGHNGDEFEELEILLCDNDGKVEAVYTSTYRGMVAKIKYTGQITRKDHESTVLELKFSEWIINPGKGSPDRTLYLRFKTGNYNKMSGTLDLNAV